MAAQRLPRYLGGLVVDLKKNSLKRKNKNHKALRGSKLLKLTQRMLV